MRSDQPWCQAFSLIKSIVFSPLIFKVHINLSRPTQLLEYIICKYFLAHKQILTNHMIWIYIYSVELFVLSVE